MEFIEQLKTWNNPRDQIKLDHANKPLHSRVKLEGRKSTWAFRRAWDGLMRMLSTNRKTMNREGIIAYLCELGKVNLVLKTAAELELNDYLVAGKPLTVKRVRQIGASVLLPQVQALCESTLNEIEQNYESFTFEEVGVKKGEIKKRIRCLNLVQAHCTSSEYPEQNATVQALLDKLSLQMNRLEDSWFLRLPTEVQDIKMRYKMLNDKIVASNPPALGGREKKKQELKNVIHDLTSMINKLDPKNDYYQWNGLCINLKNAQTLLQSLENPSTQES